MGVKGLPGWRPGVAAKRKELALLKINLIDHVNFEERQLPTHDDDKASQKVLQRFNLRNFYCSYAE